MRRPLSVAALAPALLALAVSACGGGGDGKGAKAADSAATTRRRQVTDAARKAGLPADVADFLGQSATVVGHRFHVTYDLGDGQGGTAELQQDPPHRRVDLFSKVDGKDVVRTLIAGDPKGNVVCRRTAGTWACARSRGTNDDFGSFGQGAVDKAVEDLRKSKADYDFRLAARDVAGVKARCLVTELKPGHTEAPGTGRKGTLCISAEGVPLLVETPSASLRALRYRTDVDAKVFDPPAAVKG